MSLTKVTYSMIQGAPINVQDFGAVGDGITDDTAAIQAAVIFAETPPQFNSYDRFSTGGETAGGYMGKVYFPKGAYVINDTITVSSVYLDVDFGNSIILKGGSFPSGAFAFDFTNSWTGKVYNASFFNFEKVFKLFNNNQNTGRLDFEKLEIYGADVAFDIECRSTYTTVSNCRFITVKQVAIIRSGDQVSFRDSWFSAGVITDDFGGHFEFVSPGNAAGLELIDMFYVPTPQSATKTSIVKVGVDNCRVTIDRGVFGGEPGAIPLIASYANASVTTNRGSQYTISNVMAFTSSGGGVPMIRLYALPNSIVFNNVYGTIEETHTDSLIAFDTTVQSFAAADAARLGPFGIYFVGRQINNFQGLPLANRSTLNTFVRSDLPLAYGFGTGVTNVISYSIPINNQTFFGDTRRGNAFRLCIINTGNPTSDGYSEYVVQFNFGGTAVFISPIKEGTSTASARLSTTGIDLLILTNGDTAANSFAYSVQKVADSTEGY